MLGVVDEERLLVVDVAGRISSTPVAALLSAPMPKKLARMSSRASVAPGSIWIDAELLLCVPSVPVSVKVTLYFCSCAEVLQTRTSDSNSELFAPGAWPTAGMISASGGGVFLPPGDTGETRLTETGTPLGDAP